MTALAHQEPAFARCNATRRLHNLALLKLQPLVIRLKIRRHASLSNGCGAREDKPKAVQPQTRNMHEDVQVGLNYACVTEGRRKQWTGINASHSTKMTSQRVYFRAEGSKTSPQSPVAAWRDGRVYTETFRTVAVTTMCVWCVCGRGGVGGGLQIVFSWFMIIQ